MKRIVYAFGGLAFFALGAAVATLAQKPAPEWAFDAQTTDVGWVLKCTKGCAWERLSFSCTDRTDCRVHLDQQGVYGVP